LQITGVKLWLLLVAFSPFTGRGITKDQRVICQKLRTSLLFGLLAQWQQRHQLIQGASIHGGGTATFAQRTQNGYKKIFQVNHFLICQTLNPLNSRNRENCVVFFKFAINSE
jgi:hypothetical protein